MLSVLLVDDHVALREGLGLLLERRGIEVVASVGSVAEAIVALRAREPDVAIVDLDLPGESGLSLIRRIRAAAMPVKVLIYTGSQDGLTLGDALEVGAEGIVLKPGGTSALIEALRTIAAGGRHVDPAIAAILDLAGDDHHALSKREREIFGLLAEGLSGEEIACKLFLAPETVRTHIRNAMGKLQARTRTEAVVRALEDGEIGPSH
jgi:DNA-binding NarL/FixJ family response regulator